MRISEIITEKDRSLVEAEKKERLRIAAENLYNDYLNDPELTVLSILDKEDFILSVKAK